MREKLKPCPKCKGTNLKLYTTDSRQSMRKGHVRCNQCRIKVEADSGVLGFLDWYPNIENYDQLRAYAVSEAKRKAVEEWNRRA